MKKNARKSTRILFGSIVAIVATTVTTDSAKAASYGIDFIGYYGGPGSNVTTPLPDNNPFGPTDAVQNNWNQLNWGTTVNQGGGSKNFTITDNNVANPITLTVSMNNFGGNDGGGGGATDIAALYSTGLRDNDGTITLTTAVAPFSKYNLFKYFSGNSQGGNFVLGTNYTRTDNLTGPLSFQIGALNGFSIVEVPEHRWIGGTVTLETDWATGTNWAAPASVPTSGETIIFGFADVVNPTADLGTGDRTLAGLRFASPTAMLIQSSQNDTVTMLPSTLTLNGGATTSVTVDGNSHTISAPLVLGSATTVALNVAAASLTVSGPVSGAAITKTGTGTLVLSGTNTYAGAGVNTVVSGGTLVAATPASLPGYAGGGEVTVASGATLAVRGDGTAATWQSADVDALLTANPFVVGSKLGVEVPTAATFTYNTGISGVQGLSKLGAGTFDLGGTSDYIGPTTVSVGTLQVTGTVNGSPSVTVAAAGALTVNGDLTTTTLSTAGTTNLAAASTGAIATMNVTGGSTTVAAPTVTTLNASAGTTTLGAAVTTLNVSGTGTVLGAPGAEATTVTVTGGTIDTQGNYLSVADRINMTGGNIVASGAAFGVKGSTITPNITSLGTLKLDGGTVTINMNGPQEVILSESFETDGTGTRYTSNQTLTGTPVAAPSANLWGRVTSVSGAHFGNGASPTQGSVMWVGEDTSALAGVRSGDGLQRSNASWLDLNQFNVAGKTGLKLTVDLMTNGSASGVGPETDDEFKIRIKNNVNNVTTVVEYMEGKGNAPYESILAGPNFGTKLNTPNTPKTMTYDLSGLGLTGNMQIIFAHSQSGGTGVEYLAFDNLKLMADATGPVNLPTTDLAVTSNTTLDLGYAGASTVRDVNLGSGIALTVQTATSLSMADLTGASGSQLLASGMGLTIASGTHAGSITATSVTKTSTGVLQLDGAQTYNTLTVQDGTLNVNGSLTTGTAAVAVTDTAGGAPTTLRFGSVSQTLSSLTIGAGSTVVFTSGAASGAFSGGGKISSFGGSAAVPEPGTIGLLLVGALGVLNRRRQV